MQAWDANPPPIDAAAVWGTAREHIMEGGDSGERKARALLTSGVISG